MWMSRATEKLARAEEKGLTFVRQNQRKMMDMAVLGEIVYSLGKTMGMVASRLGPLYVCKRTGLSVDMRKIFPQLAYRILLCSISQGSVQKKMM